MFPYSRTVFHIIIENLTFPVLIGPAFITIIHLLYCALKLISVRIYSLEIDTVPSIESLPLWFNLNQLTASDASGTARFSPKTICRL